jgi:hypothetical protein
MIIRLIIAVALLAVLFYGLRHIRSLPPGRRKSLWWKLGLGGLVVISLLLVATGRLHPVGGLLALFAAIAKFGTHALFRLWPLLRATGKDAVFRTEHLEVRFLVRTSELQGQVLKGRYAGEALHTMSAEQLQELAGDYQDKDRKSYYLVRVFLQRAGTDQGRFRQAHEQGQSESHQAAFAGNPSREEALLILGLSGNPTEKDIIAAHRRLIQKLHPDRGGNDYLAARINQAKDVLLKH